MTALQNLPGVFTVVGPMCHWDMQITDKTGHTGTPRKRTKWVTNSPVLAKTLDVRCSNELGTEPIHVHLHLINGLAKQAAKYPPKLVRAVLKALKAQMTQDGEINHISMKFGGPDPTQEALLRSVCEGAGDVLLNCDGPPRSLGQSCLRFNHALT